MYGIRLDRAIEQARKAAADASLTPDEIRAATVAYHDATVEWQRAYEALISVKIALTHAPSADKRKAHDAASSEYAAVNRRWTPACKAMLVARVYATRKAATLTDITNCEDQVQDYLRTLKPFTHSEPDQRDKDRKMPAPIHPLNLILYGPPGTGKTWHAVTRAVAIVENRDVSEVERDDREDRAAVKGRFDELRTAGRIAMATFHQNTTYEEFIEGIRPVLGAAAGDVRYELSRGVFRRIADSKRIGRDDEARAILPGSKTDFGVPANLHVVGTMNTADRSIALLDTALRRRFVFEERMPDPNLVSPDAGGVDCRKLLAAMNDRIALLDREHRIGHTYFLRVDSVEALAETFRTRIVPLLQEYFYDDWEKIRAVLNRNEFVRESKPPDELVRSNLVDAEQRVYELPPADDGRWTDPKQYRKIYDVKAQADQAEDSGAAQDD